MSKKPKQPIQLKIATAIRSRRESLKVSQEAFAERLGVHRTYYGALERGEKDLRVSTLERVCKALNIKMSELIADTEG